MKVKHTGSLLSAVLLSRGEQECTMRDNTTAGASCGPRCFFLFEPYLLSLSVFASPEAPRRRFGLYLWADEGS